MTTNHVTDVAWLIEEYKTIEKYIFPESNSDPNSNVISISKFIELYPIYSMEII